MRRTLVIAGLNAAVVFGQAAAGQTTLQPDTQKHLIIQMGDVAEFGPVGITAAMAGPQSTVAGAPYSAQAVTQRVQTLADGNRIEQTTSGTVARDSQGRVRRDEALPGFTSGSGDSPHLVMIQDPVAGVHWTLDVQNKTAMKMPLAQMKSSAKGTPFVPPPLGPEKTFFFTTTSPGPQATAKAPDSSMTKSNLGAQTIEGIAALGTRTTRTIPAGAVGNEQPILITTDVWYSPDLKVLVMSKTTDPRMGETTYKLTGIQRSEPPASLFQIPDDYTITDQPVNTFVFHEKKTP